MPTNTYVALATQTLVSNTATVTFSSISSAYTDLVFILNVKGSVSGVDDDVTARFNSDTGSNYSWTRIYGDGTTAGSQRGTAQTVLRAGNQSGTGSSAFSPMILNIMNYSNTTTYKTMLGRPNNPARVVDGYVNLWRDTSAISTVSFACGGDFIAGSTFSLYGIKADANTAYATGGTITSDAGYFYHTFTASGTFTPSQALTADYLVVAGGGASSQGAGASGGGGAGGLRSTVTATGGGGSLETPLSLTAQAYTVTVGAGGVGGAGLGTNGSDSVFSTITSVGGGRSGGANPNQNGALGGSGGGGGEQSAIYGTGGAGTANQGYAGGAAGSAVYRMGGGGGAGAVGVAGGALSGNGGAGVAVSISGSSVTYAGGGGGAAGASAGTGGAGGGGNGGTNVIGVAGTVNTGGGGGGSYVANGVSGGSGIVIVRYAR